MTATAAAQFAAASSDCEHMVSNTTVLPGLPAAPHTHFAQAAAHAVEHVVTTGDKLC